MNLPTPVPHALSALREDLEISFQVDRAGRHECVVRDPRNGNVYCFPRKAFDILRLTRAGMTLADLSAAVPAAAPPKVAALVAKAAAAGLFDDVAHVAVANGAGRRRHLLRLFWVIGEWPVERLARRCTPLLAPLFGVLRIPVACLLLAALAMLAWHGARYVDMLKILPGYPWWGQTVPLLLASYLWHELGHLSAACLYGARQARAGVVLYLLVPAAFVRIDDVHLIAQRRQRVAVALAGVYFDAIVFALAFLLWCASQNFSVINQVCLVVSLGAAVRIGANLFPFWRMDGYRALEELCGVRKLRVRAVQALLALLPGARWLPPGRRHGVPRAALIGYAALHLLASLSMVLWTHQFFMQLMGAAGAGWGRVAAFGAAGLVALSLVLQTASDARQTYTGRAPC
ncbi:site-2 protease family protein [Massilia sp. DWR3-1-1]|uniref:site-2 protease family protein n=1 Tax=Massilia sp. DWR3-1-1 TaxID=2804559 RepID=UPI003CF4369B